MQIVKVLARGKMLAIRTALNKESLSLLRTLPDQQGWKGSDLIVAPTHAVMWRISELWPGASWDEKSKELRGIAYKQVEAKAAVANLKYEPKTKPFVHQEKGFELCHGREFFALLMEQGTGKTKITLDDIAWCYQQGTITGALIIADNGVHSNWAQVEIPIHLPDWCTANVATWNSKKPKSIDHLYDPKVNAKLGQHLSILCMNVEALSTAKGEAICKKFLLTFPSMTVIDEATSIKTPKSKRTKAALRLGSYSPKRRILTGTPVTKGPLDLYAPFSFLSEDILGHSSFYTFRARYAVMKPLPGKKDRRGRAIEIPVAWQHLEELKDKIKSASYRVLKKDCFDLPPKLYKRRPFQMTVEQWALYKQMEEEKEVEFNGRRITAPMAMVRQMRLSQIALGYLPNEDPDGPAVRIPGGNPRLEALISDLEVLKDAEGKVLIYAPWTCALRDIYVALVENFGKDSFVVMSEKQSVAERDEAKRIFQIPDNKVRFFLMQAKIGSKGHTLTAAAYVQYFSQRYDLEIRLQSEDRPHRYGQHNPVLYTDYEAMYSDQCTTDRDVIDNLKAKKLIADIINGDEHREDWMTDEWAALEMNKIDKAFYQKYGAN